MILKMSKVSIIGPQRLLPEVMDSVYKAGIIHIESPPDSVKDKVLPIVKTIIEVL